MNNYIPIHHLDSPVNVLPPLCKYMHININTCFTKLFESSYKYHYTLSLSTSIGISYEQGPSPTQLSDSLQMQTISCNFLAQIPPMIFLHTECTSNFSQSICLCMIWSLPIPEISSSSSLCLVFSLPVTLTIRIVHATL